MANIDRIVSVQIELRTAAITTTSFSDLLLLGTFRPQTTERVIIITDPDELTQSYGVPNISPLYRAANVAFSQIPTVPQLFIGQKDPVGLPPPNVTITALTPHWAPVGTPGDPDIVLRVTGTGFTPQSRIQYADMVPDDRTIYVSDTELNIIASDNTFSAVQTFPVRVIDPLGRSNALIFTVVAAGDAAPVVPAPPAADPPGPFDFMTAIRGENNDWYGFCDTDHVEADVLGYALWAEANQKIQVTVLSNVNNITPPATDTTSVAAQLHNGNYFRTAWWWNPSATEFTDVAITARSFTKYPGGETWANQRLNAVQATQLNETTARNIFGKDGNTFEPFRNIALTQRGRVAAGEWIDVIRFRDWLCEEIRIRVFQQMIDNRIPYTDPGIAQIRTRIAQALDFGVDRGGIAPKEIDADGNVIPSYTIKMPLSANVSFNNKANRILQDCYFTARLAGAIHVVEIKGVLTYENLLVGA